MVQTWGVNSKEQTRGREIQKPPGAHSRQENTKNTLVPWDVGTTWFHHLNTNLGKHAHHPTAGLVYKTKRRYVRTSYSTGYTLGDFHPEKDANIIQAGGGARSSHKAHFTRSYQRGTRSIPCIHPLSNVATTVPASQYYLCRNTSF